MSIDGEIEGGLGYMSMAQLREYAIESNQYGEERAARAFGTRVFLTCLRNGASSVPLVEVGLPDEKDQFGWRAVLAIDSVRAMLENGAFVSAGGSGWSGTHLGEKGLALVSSYIDSRERFIGRQQR